MSKLTKLIVLGALFLFLGGFFWDAPKEGAQSPTKKVRAEIDKSQVKTGQTFSYSILIEGKFRNPEIKKPPLKNFEIISTQRSQSISRQEGKTKVRIEITYLLIAPKPGNFLIKPVEVIDAGKTYQSKEIKIKVEGDPLEEKREPPPALDRGTEI